MNVNKILVILLSLLAKNWNSFTIFAMFEWRFQISPGIIPQSFLETAYFAGWGRVPRQTQTFVHENNLFIRSDTLGSGTIHIPMPHAPLGVVMESTESVLSRQEPYLLVKELARGALGRFYRRLFDWQMLGFVLSNERTELLHQIAKRFATLVIGNTFSHEIEQGFLTILDELAPLTVETNKEFTEQSVSWRTRNNERLPLILGIGTQDLQLETFSEFGTYAELLHRSFHVVSPMPTWRELETQPGEFDWERWEQHLLTPLRFGFQCALGPLISFNREALPHWLLPRLGEEGFFETRATRFVNTIAERYGYLAHHWILANRFMDQSLPEIPADRLMALIRLLAQQMRSRGVEVPIIVGITQPWGEYAIHTSPDWEQVQIAEMLMGCREIDTFLLEMDFGCGEHRSLPRDPMTIGNMIDQWSFLGKKVYVSFSVPSAGFPLGTSIDIAPEHQWSEEKQRVWTETILLTLLGKRTVRGIFWSSLQDPIIPSQSLPEFNYGLLNAQQILKPSFKHFTAAQKNLLQ